MSLPARMAPDWGPEGARGLSGAKATLVVAKPNVPIAEFRYYDGVPA